MLFRSEVHRYKAGRALGRAVPLHASDTLPLVGIIFACVLLLAIWLVTGSYSRTEIVSGWVVPSGPAVRIYPAGPGRLVSLDVAEGQRVRAGQRLGTIEIQSASRAGSDPAGQSLAILERQQRQLDQQRRLAMHASEHEAQRLNQAARQMQLRLASMEKQLTLQRQRVESARRSFAILSDAEEKNYISRIDFENQKRAFLDEQAQLQVLMASRSELQGALGQTHAQLRQVPLSLGERLSELDTGAMLLDRQRIDIEGTRALVLEAPIDGRVTALQARIGSTMRPQIPAMYVLGDAAELEVELFAPSRAIGFARPGQHVRLMYDAFPYQQYGSFGGTVYEISRAALGPGEIDAPLRFEEPVYRVRIRLDRQAIRAFGRDHAIQPGMTLAANLILERQSFLGWLLEPINAVRNRS